MKKTWKLVLILLSVVLIAGIGFSTGYAQQKSGALSEKGKEFVNEAASGGMMEVRLGEMAAKHAASADVKQFGNRMATDHSKVNQELMRIAQNKGVSVPKEMNKKHQAEVDRLSKLSGPEFDRAYMDAMVKDHEKDVANFSKAAKEVDDPDLQAFAARTVPILEEHLKIAKDINARLGGAGGGKR